MAELLAFGPGASLAGRAAARLGADGRGELMELTRWRAGLLQDRRGPARDFIKCVATFAANYPLTADGSGAEVVPEVTPDYSSIRAPERRPGTLTRDVHDWLSYLLHLAREFVDQSLPLADAQILTA